jgi:hypothetical protein
MRGLTEGDLKTHAALGITPDLLASAQVQRVTDSEARNQLAMNGWPATRSLEGLLYPYIAPNSGYVVTRRLRRDRPEVENGKPKDKYISGYGDRRHLYFPPGCAPLLADTSVTVVAVEAEKSVLAVVSAASAAGRKVLAFGTGGCWGWRGTVGKAEDASGARVDERGPLPDLDLISWVGRQAVIAFDANAATNPKVQQARRAFATELSKRGATVRLLDLPTEPGINGPDDYIGRHGPVTFFTLLDSATSTGCSLTVRKASDVPDETLQKLFGGRLIRGAFGLLVGPGEGGKGMFLVDITSRLTTGEPFPGEATGRPPVNVLMCVTEDSEGRVKARLRAAGADLDRVLFIGGPEVVRGGLRVPSPMMLDDDAGSLVQFAKDLKAAALFLETTVEHFGDREGKRRHSTNTEAEVRRALAPFREVCRAARLYSFGVIHPRKSMEGGVTDSISGSAAFRNVTRGTYHIYPDPTDDTPQPRRLLFTGKTNYLRRRPETLRFRIVAWDPQTLQPCTCMTEAECVHEGRVLWDDDLVDDRMAERIWQEIAERGKPRTDVAVEEAEKFLTRVLENGQLTVEQIRELAKAEMITPAALKRAKGNLQVISVKDGFPAKVVAWRLPEVEL